MKILTDVYPVGEMNSGSVAIAGVWSSSVFLLLFIIIFTLVYWALGVGFKGASRFMLSCCCAALAVIGMMNSGASVLLIPYAGMGFALLATLIFLIIHALWQPFRRMIPERSYIKQKAERPWPADGPRGRKWLSAIQAVKKLLRFLARAIWLSLLWLWPRVKRGVRKAISRYRERRSRD